MPGVYMRSRFAPSPTGLLHVGNARTALLAYVWLMQQGGQFFLRIDDTDLKRESFQGTQDLQADLSWLGLHFHETVYQSKRSDVYGDCVAFLQKKGLLYPCYETQEELEEDRKSALARGLPPRYERRALKLSEKDKKKFEAEGRLPYWRFKLDDRAETWEDCVKGSLAYHTRHLSDPVVLRHDGTLSFLLAGAIDDAEMRMTHVLRGEDHIANTAVQRQMIRSLKPHLRWADIAFGHVPLVKGDKGALLSKRTQGGSLRSLRAHGITQQVLCAWLLSLGRSDELPFMDNLADFPPIKWTDYGRGQVSANFRRLAQRQAIWWQKQPWGEIKKLLQKKGYEKGSETFWVCVRQNIENQEDLLFWYHVCFEKEAYQSNAPSFVSIATHEEKKIVAECSELLAEKILLQAQKSLPKNFLNKDTWALWVKDIAEKCATEKKIVYKMLRYAITKKFDGPKMAELLPLMAIEKVKTCLVQEVEKNKEVHK